MRRAWQWVETRPDIVWPFAFLAALALGKLLYRLPAAEDVEWGMAATAVAPLAPGLVALLVLRRLDLGWRVAMIALAGFVGLSIAGSFVDRYDWYVLALIVADLLVFVAVFLWATVWWREFRAAMLPAALTVGLVVVQGFTAGETLVCNLVGPPPTAGDAEVNVCARMAGDFANYVPWLLAGAYLVTVGLLIHSRNRYWRPGWPLLLLWGVLIAL